ncbi:unnamed protein product, partial [Brassica rapa]
MDCSGDFVPCGLSVENTQDVWGCQLAHTGRPWLSVCVRVCPSVAVSTHRTSVAVHPHISTLVLGLSTLALPVDCLGHFGPRRLSVQYTQDVCGCPPAHKGHLWLSVTVRQHTHDICGFPCVSVCVCGCPPAYTGRSWLSVAVCHHTQDVRVCQSAHTGHPCVCVCVRQHTQDVRGCPSAHTGRQWLSISTHISTLA